MNVKYIFFIESSKKQSIYFNQKVKLKLAKNKRLENT